MARNGSQKSHDRAREIYLSAAQIFAQKGFDATSLADVAEALNITKAALYYYVESKQELLFQIMSLGLDRIEEEVMHPAREIKDAEARLEHLILNFARLVAGGNASVALVSDELRALTLTQRETIVERRRTFLEIARETLIELKTDGKLNDLEITTATFTLYGMILWIPRWFKSEGAISKEQICREITRMALRGVLRAPKLAEAKNSNNFVFERQ